MKTWQKVVSLVVSVAVMFNTHFMWFEAHAVTDFSDIYTDELTFMTDEMANLFIGFIYDKKAELVSDEERSLDDMFNYLTGKLEKGTDEYKFAQVAFLKTCQDFINMHLAENERISTISTDNVLGLLQKRVGSNPDLAQELVNSELGKVKSSIKKILYYVGGFEDSDIMNQIDLAMSGYETITGTVGKVQDLLDSISLIINTWLLVTSTNTYKAYFYFSQYLNFRDLGPDATDVYMDYITIDTTLIDGFSMMMSNLGFGNTWTSEGVQRALRTFAEFTYHSQLEMQTSSQELPVEIEKIEFEVSTYDLALNTPVDTKVLYYPENATVDKTITFSTSNSNVAKVSSTGKITPVGAGTARITATTNAGIEGFCEIQVYPFSVAKIASGYSISNCVDKTISQLTIPAYINNVPVCEIGDEAFKNCTEFTLLVFPYEVKSIGSNAFENCTSLTKVAFADVKTIGSSAFAGCKSLTELLFFDEINTINTKAFYNCTSLTNITIPSSVTSIGLQAFCGCDSLEEFVVDDNNENYVDVDGVLFDKEKNTLIQYPAKKEATSYTVPDGVKTVKEYAFYNCDILQSVIIPDSVTEIGYKGELEHEFVFGTSNARGHSFYDCDSLTRVVLPKNLEVLGKRTFYGCDKLADMTIPDTVSSIGAEAFSNTAYYNNESNWGNGVLYINNHLLKASTNLTGAYEIKDGTITVADGAFQDCSTIETITVPNSLKNIGFNTFSCCSGLKGIYISDITSWCDINFHGNIFPWFGNEVISNPLYYAKNLYLNGEIITDLVIPEEVKTIKAFAFANCEKLKSVTIHSGLSKIEEQVFDNCDMLNRVDFKGTYEQWKDIAMETDIEKMDNVKIYLLDDKILIAYAIVPILGGGVYARTKTICGFDAKAKVAADEKRCTFTLLGDMDTDEVYTANDYDIMTSLVSLKTRSMYDQDVVGDLNFDGVADGFDAVILDLKINGYQ